MAANKQVYESKRVKMGTAAIVFNVIGYLLVGLVALVCLLPFIMLISGSFSSEQAIRFTGYGLLPKEFTLEAYRIVFKYPQKIARAYGVSISITLIGTALGLFITTKIGRAHV